MIKNDLTYKIIGCAMKVHNKTYKDLYDLRINRLIIYDPIMEEIVQWIN
jgi:hypothetical protein